MATAKNMVMRRTSVGWLEVCRAREWVEAGLEEENRPFPTKDWVISLMMKGSLISSLILSVSVEMKALIESIFLRLDISGPLMLGRKAWLITNRERRKT